MRMRKLLMLITSVSVEIQLNLYERSWDSIKGNNMAQIKIHNGGYYAHAQTSNA